jgi:hypothetical protein
MRNYEIIKEIHKRLPSLDMFGLYSKDQLFDRIMDCRDLIERERPEMSDGLWEKVKNEV